MLDRKRRRDLTFRNVAIAPDPNSQAEYRDLMAKRLRAALRNAGYREAAIGSSRPTSPGFVIIDSPGHTRTILIWYNGDSGNPDQTRQTRLAKTLTGLFNGLVGRRKARTLINRTGSGVYVSLPDDPSVLLGLPNS